MQDIIFDMTYHPTKFAGPFSSSETLDNLGTVPYTFPSKIPAGFYSPVPPSALLLCKSRLLRFPPSGSTEWFGIDQNYILSYTSGIGWHRSTTTPSVPR